MKIWVVLITIFLAIPLSKFQLHYLLVALECTLEMTMIILLLKKPPRYHIRLFGLKSLFLKRKIYFVVFCKGNSNNRDRFLKYIDDKLEFYTSKGNPVFVLTDSNIDLL